MKRNKIVCLDEDVVEFLKGRNASKLINNLLLEVMQKERYEGMSISQLEVEQQIIEMQKESEAKAKEMRKNA